MLSESIHTSGGSHAPGRRTSYSCSGRPGTWHGGSSCLDCSACPGPASCPIAVSWPRRSKTSTTPTTTASPVPPVTNTSVEKLATTTGRNSNGTSLYVPGSDGPHGLARAVARVRVDLGGQPRRLHYLSIPPSLPTRWWRPSRRPGPSSGPGSSWRSPSDRSRQRPEAERRGARGLRRGADLSHRPLPWQGGGAQHLGLSLR